MPDIIHRIGIKASTEKVFHALSSLEGLRGWWTDEATGAPVAGANITFTFNTPGGDVIGAMVMKVEDLKKAELVRWRCVDGPPDWVGTRFTFELSEQDGQTIVMFGHRDWAQATESMAHCSMKWAVFLLSLREFVETGAGRPSPGDMKIDNWN